MRCEQADCQLYCKALSHFLRTLPLNPVLKSYPTPPHFTRTRGTLYIAHTQEVPDSGH